MPLILITPETNAHKPHNATMIAKQTIHSNGKSLDPKLIAITPIANIINVLIKRILTLNLNIR